MNKGDRIKLVDGRTVKIVNLPKSFMANGSYEVLHDGAQVSFWVKPEEVLYQIDEDNVDDLNNYFEVIFDRDGLNIIPKNIGSINIESDREDINRIRLNFRGNNKHNVCDIHIGNVVITDDMKISKRPKKKKKSKLKRIINILKNKDGK